MSITLTPEGRRLARDTLDIGDEMMRELTRDWSNDDLQQWITLSRRLAVSVRNYSQSLTAEETDGIGYQA